MAGLLHPIVREWFGRTFERPTPAQAEGWPAIAGGRHTLISAPTGSGKTLAFGIPLIERTESAAPRRPHSLVIVPTRELANQIAIEHLELMIDDPWSQIPHIRHAGAIFLGRYTPEAIGDYIAGPNHVLPTARASRYASGLSVLNFMKRSSLVRCDAPALAEIGPSALRLAEAEGLHAHGLSISIRLGSHAQGSGFTKQDDHGGS